MDIITTVFGEEKHVNLMQMACRAVIMFIIALFLIRLAGVKTFGKSTAFDNIITIMMGAILSKGVLGEEPFMSVVFASLALVLMTRFVSWLCIRSPAAGQLIKGKSALLFSDGHIDHRRLHEVLLSERDFIEGIRKHGNTTNLATIDQVFLERSGEMSVIKKEK